jgi:hypothetical protein
MGPLFAVLLASAPGPDPARLAGVRFAEAGEVQRVRAGSWRPSDPRNSGRSVRFVSPGRMVLDWRTDGVTCGLSSRRDGAGWALSVDCGSGPSAARWDWLPGGGARTSVFLVAAPQMSEAAVELARFDRDFAAVEKEYRTDYRLRALHRLTGRWLDAGWEVQVVLDAQRPALDGRPAQVEAEPCLPLAAEPDAAHRICLSVTADGGDRLQLVEQGDRLYECAWDEGPDGAQYDLARGSRIFSRATASAASP